MKAKSKRNTAILKDYQKGTSIYKIAKKHGISWTRTKVIVKQELRRKENEA